MGEGRLRWRVAGWGRRWRGRHRGHFQSPRGIVERGGRRQSIWHAALHMSQKSTYVTEQHLLFVEWALTYLSMDIVRWGGKGASRKGGGHGRDRELGKARVRLE